MYVKYFEMGKSSSFILDLVILNNSTKKGFKKALFFIEIS